MKSNVSVAKKGTPDFSTANGNVRIFEGSTGAQYNFFVGDANLENRKNKTQPYNKRSSVYYFPFLTGVTVVENNLNSFKIQFSIDIPYAEAMIVLSTGAFLIGNKVVANMGYVGDMAGPWVGMITQGGQSLTIGPDGVSGTITVTPTKQTDKKFFASAGGASKNLRKWIKAAASALENNVQVESIASKRLADYGDNVYMPSNMTAEEVLTYVCGVVNCKWEYRKPRFGDIDGVKLDGTYDEIYISSLPYSDGKEVKSVRDTYRKFILRGSFDYKKRIYPITEMSPKLNAALFAPDVYYATGNIEGGKVVTAKTEEPNSVKHNNSKPEAGKATQIKVMAPHGIQKNKVDLKQVKEEQIRDVGKMGDKGAIAVSGTINTLGIPDMRAWENIIVDTEAKLINGVYVVKQVTNVYTPGEYNLTLDVFRKAL